MVTCVLLAAAAAAATGCGPKRPAGATTAPAGRVDRAAEPLRALPAPAHATTGPATPGRSPFAYEEPFPPAAPPAGPAASRDITVVELANSLKREPITVGFDIDDTVLFSTPAFYAGRAKYGEDFLRNPNFWTDLNTNLDAQFSVPKEIARLLLQLHTARGDHLVFISARPPGDAERATRAMKELLRGHFRLPDDIQVVFTNLKPKTQALRDTGVTIYYGDSDGDIIDSLVAGTPIRPIRVLRSKYSSNGDTPHNGQMGEEVLLHSEE